MNETIAESSIEIRMRHQERVDVQQLKFSSQKVLEPELS